MLNRLNISFYLIALVSFSFLYHRLGFSARHLDNLSCILFFGTNMRTPSALDHALDTDWILCEEVRVVWQNALGEIAVFDAETLEQHPPMLWIGARSQNKPWVVALQTTLNPRIHGRHAKFDFFMFLNLQLSCGAQGRPFQGQGETLKLSFQQNAGQPRCTPGNVLMQKRAPDPPLLLGASWHLMSRIRTLSECTSFDVYIANKSTTRGVLNKLANEHPKSVEMLNINETTSYNGKGGVWDAWDAYVSDSPVRARHRDLCK
jgi:hypothetical protein